MTDRFAYGQNVAPCGAECPAVAAGAFDPYEDGVPPAHISVVIGSYDNNVKNDPDADRENNTVGEDTARGAWLAVLDHVEHPEIEQFVRVVADELGWL